MGTTTPADFQAELTTLLRRAGLDASPRPNSGASWAPLPGGRRLSADDETLMIVDGEEEFLLESFDEGTDAPDVADALLRRWKEYAGEAEEPTRPDGPRAFRRAS